MKINTEDTYAWLLNIQLFDSIPLARVVYSDKLDGYGAYYALLPVRNKVIPVELGKDYFTARLAVDSIRQIYYTEKV